MLWVELSGLLRMGLLHLTSFVFYEAGSLCCEQENSRPVHILLQEITVYKCKVSNNNLSIFLIYVNYVKMSSLSHSILIFVDIIEYF